MCTRLILFFILSLFAVNSNAQSVIPFVDFNGYFRSFQNGFFRQIEFQQIRNFKAGDDVVGYIDNRGNLRVYDGTKPQDLTNIPTVEYEVSDDLLVWKIGETLNLWDDGSKRTLTYFAQGYWVKDSMVVYQDTRWNSLNVYYEGNTYELTKATGSPPVPDAVGENLLVYRDNGNFYKVFWKGEIYELDVWHRPIEFVCGTDILAFNDPMTGTFAIFENGEFLDVEDFHMNSYGSGRGFIVYENQNNDLMYYGNGERKQLTNFGATFWQAKDDAVFWAENGRAYAFVNGEKKEVANYVPEEYKVKNGIIAFRNILGGIDVFVDGKLKTLTNQQDAEYSLFGNAVLVELFNKNFLLYKDGREFRN